MPNLSVCHVCKTLLESKLESLGKTANEAVAKFTPETDASKDNMSSNEENVSDDDGHDDGETSGDDHSLIDFETCGIETLYSKISSWAHVQTPKH